MLKFSCLHLGSLYPRILIKDLTNENNAYIMLTPFSKLQMRQRIKQFLNKCFSKFDNLLFRITQPFSILKVKVSREHYIFNFCAFKNTPSKRRWKQRKGSPQTSDELANYLLRMNSSNGVLSDEEDISAFDINEASTNFSIEVNETLTPTSTSNWAQNSIPFIRCYILPTLILMGVVFNIASILVLEMKRLRMKRSLARLFVCLNISDM